MGFSLVEQEGRVDGLRPHRQFSIFMVRPFAIRDIVHGSISWIDEMIQCPMGPFDRSTLISLSEYL